MQKRDFRYQTAVEMLQASPAACPGLRVWQVPGSYDAALAECLESLGVRAVGFESAHVSVARHAAWERACRGRGLALGFVATDRAVERLRVIKDDEEIARLRARRGRPDAGGRGGDSPRCGPASRRTRWRGVIEAAMRAAGYERPAFDTIVGVGAERRAAALPRRRAKHSTKATSSCWTSAASWTDTARDLTRTVSVGPPSSDALRVHAAVLAAQRRRSTP